jgi:ferredoxin
MPTIEIVDSPVGRDKTVEAPEGGDLLDLCDEHYLPVPFSCRSATCATCHVEVVQGTELIEPPGEEERETLSYVGGPEGSRLACQVQVRPGSGLLQIRPLG